MLTLCITPAISALADDVQPARQAVPPSGVVIIWGGGEIPAALQQRFAAAKWMDVATLTLPAEPLDRLLISPAAAEQPVPPGTIELLEKRPGLVGAWVPRQTALVAHGRNLMVIGAGPVTILLPASATRPGQRPVHVRQLASGERADLVALSRAALARRGPVFPAAETHVPQVLQGTLLACGGGDIPDSVWRRFVELAGGIEAPIVLIPIATPNPDLAQPQGVKELARLGCRRVTVLRQQSRAEVESPEFAGALRAARGVWLVGGRQWRYVDAYEGTIAEQLIHDVLRRGGVVAGTSAGAAIQGEYLVRGDPLGNKNIIAEGYERGLSLLPGTAIDIHVTERGRLPEMLHLVHEFPQLLGISIDEQTAVEIHGHAMEVLGLGRVAVVTDGTAEPPTLRAGERFDLKNRRRID